MSSNPHGSNEKPSAKQLLGFSAMALPISGALLPLGVFLPTFYATDLGLGLAATGTVFMLSRLWGALNDPLVGWLSDRTRSRYGRRKPWIVAGGLLAILCTFALFMPPRQVSALYLGLALYVFSLGWSMVSIPLYAWGGELSPDYHQRSRVQAYIVGAIQFGLLLVLLFPTFLDALGRPALRGKLAAIAWFMIATTVLGLALITTSYRERRPSVTSIPPVAATPPWGLLAESIVWRVMASDFCVAFGQSIRGALFLFFVAAVAGKPQWAAGLFLLQFIFGAFAAPLWLRIGYRLGKHRTVIAAELLQVAINLALLLVTRDTAALLLGLTAAQGLTQGSGNLMLRAIVADVSDAWRAKSGEDRTGLLFSVFNVTFSVGAALAVGAALPLVAWFGFKPGAINTPSALAALQWTFACGPALGHLLSAILVWRFPLDQQAHAAIRATLAQRDKATC